ncbi:MAG: hypothetical protein Q8P06_02365 [Candidatus Azambacteria bacterium]|nr:hypothetical protein [Candidatus Azambacteria bacterium]
MIQMPNLKECPKCKSEEDIKEEVKKQFKLNIRSLHGIKHWERVEKIGLRLAETTNADIRVVSLFSL